MFRLLCALLLCVVFASCKPEPAQQPQQASAQGLKKLRNVSDEQIRQLREAGAEIIVQEADYVVVRTDSVQQAFALNFESISESDLVQRLANIYLKDKSELQQIVDTGVDLWEVRGDTVVASVFDIHIDKLKNAGFTVEIIAQDAAKREEKH